MNSTEGAVGKDFRYVELAPHPVLPLIEKTAQAADLLQDIKAERKEQISMSLNSNNELSKHHYKTPGCAPPVFRRNIIR